MVPFISRQPVISSFLAIGMRAWRKYPGRHSFKARFNKACLQALKYSYRCPAALYLALIRELLRAAQQKNARNCGSLWLPFMYTIANLSFYNVLYFLRISDSPNLYRLETALDKEPANIDKALLRSRGSFAKATQFYQVKKRRRTLCSSICLGFQNTILNVLQLSSSVRPWLPARARSSHHRNPKVLFFHLQTPCQNHIFDHNIHISAQRLSFTARRNLNHYLMTFFIVFPSSIFLDSCIIFEAPPIFRPTTRRLLSYRQLSKHCCCFSMYEETRREINLFEIKF